MKALVLLGPERIALQDMAEPEPQDGEALVRIEAAGICGSDLHSYRGQDPRRPPPVVLGHEACGVIAAGPHRGRRVVINPQIPCGRCPSCASGRTNVCTEKEIVSVPPRAGSFAELVAVPERNLYEVPDGLTPEQAALTEPLATAYHAAALAERHGAQPLAQAAALVIGGGAIGLGTALALAARGCQRIDLAERNALRRESLRARDRVRAFDPETEPGPERAEVVIDAVGTAATRAHACRAVAPSGVIVHLGLQDEGADGLDLRRLTLCEVVLLGSYTYTGGEFAETLAAMTEGRFGALDWFELRGLADGPAAFAALEGGRAAAAKIILRP